MLVRFAVLIAAATAALAQPATPSFRVEDIRPQGAAEPHPLAPGLAVWIFGTGLAGSPGCTVTNVMDPATYRTELCGVRVLFNGIEATLLFVSPSQINLIAPDHPWENEFVAVQVIHAAAASALVPVRFGWNHTTVSLAAPAHAGGPIWLHVEKPYGKGALRYPFWLEPWEFGGATVEVRFGDALLSPLSLPRAGPLAGSMQIGLPHEVPPKYRDRLPLHLRFRLDRPGIYQVRYTDYRYAPRTTTPVVDQQSEWTAIELLPSTRVASLPNSPPRDTVELLSDYLPSLLAGRDAATLLALAPYLNSRDDLVRQYALYALNYFDPDLLARVLPGSKALQGGVR